MITWQCYYTFLSYPPHSHVHTHTLTPHHTDTLTTPITHVHTHTPTPHPPTHTPAHTHILTPHTPTHTPAHTHTHPHTHTHTLTHTHRTILQRQVSLVMYRSRVQVSPLMTYSTVTSDSPPILGNGLVCCCLGRLLHSPFLCEPKRDFVSQGWLIIMTLDST